MPHYGVVTDRYKLAAFVIVPAVSAEQAYALVKASGCGTAKVKVADHEGSLAEDLAQEALAIEWVTKGYVRALGHWVHIRDGQIAVLRDYFIP